MTDVSVAESLPGLYRQVLDAVAGLEQAGLRRDADRIRADATVAYSKAWDEVAARRLLRLREDARRMIVARQRPRTLRPWHAGRGRPVEGRPA